MPGRSEAVAPSLAADVTPCVGVLFVHGAGDHGVGSTLIEFGEPLVAWLDGWLSRGEQAPTSDGDAARAGAAQILVREADAHAPAHSAVTLRSQRDGKPHVWLLAEARWDEAFTPPAFKQVLLWAIGVVPWTVLTQFIGPLIDESRLLRPDLLAILRFFWNIVASTFLALVAAVVLQTVALVILVLSIIPLDPVRDVVSRLQRFASSSVGDLYMVLTSPIQRAALTSAVQRDVDWLRAQGCERVAVIAHSQGGYVAYQALADAWYRPVDTFVTFGSGLIRLTESERARRTGLLAPALIGVIGALIAIRFAPTAILGTFEIWEKHQASGLAFVVGAVMAVGLAIAIRHYRAEKEVPPDLPSRAPWIDFVTNEDPVLNGSRAGRLPGRVHKVRVQNRASVVADHGSYWQNSDQFVARVAMKVGWLDPELGLLRAGPIVSARSAARHLRKSWRRRQERVAALERVRGPIAIATALLLLIRSDQLESVGKQVAGVFAWVPAGLVSWLPDVIESIIPIAISHLALLGAAVIVGLSLVGYRMGVGLWEGWSRADTEAQWAGRPPNPLSRRVVAFYAWTVIQVALIAIVLLVGPATILLAIGDGWANRDAIVQSWARQYLWSFVVAGIVLVAIIVRTRVLTRSQVVWIVRGTVLALLFELVIAVVWPGPMKAVASIPIGLAAEGAGLLLVYELTPWVSTWFERLAARAQRFIEPAVVKGPVATPVDRLGVAGIVAMGIAAALALVDGPVALAFGALFALVAIGLTVVMATNTAERSLPLIGKTAMSPRQLQLAGWVGVAAGVVLLVVELARGLAWLTARLLGSSG
jgi:hypothetical protein